MQNYLYTGDCNLYHGGLFIERPGANETRQDWADIVQVTDLDSAMGFGGPAVMIEAGTVYLGAAIDKIDSALSCTGCAFIEPHKAPADEWPPIDDNGTRLEPGTDDHWRALVYGVNAYQGMDQDSMLTIASKETDGVPNWEIDARVNCESHLAVARFISREYGVTVSGAS